MVATSEALNKLLDALRDDAARIRDAEARAQKVLHEQGDKEGYETLLREKCAIMQELARHTPEAVTVLDDDVAEWVADELDGYGRRASQALSVGSVFFMSALLYPDDYQDGQDNDLERFIRALEKRALA